MAVAETAIGASFRKSGVVPLKVELRVALSRFHNLGLSFNDMRAELDDLERMSGMGQTVCAASGQIHHAQTRQPTEGGEVKLAVPKGQDPIASPPSSNHDERGQSASASSGHEQGASSRRVPDRGGEGLMKPANHGHSVTALPVREPSAAFRAAALESRKATARSVLYKHRTSDGKKWWGDVCPYERYGMTRDVIRMTALMSAVGPLNDKQEKMPFSQLLAPKLAEIAWGKAEKELANVR